MNRGSPRSGGAGVNRPSWSSSRLSDELGDEIPLAGEDGCPIVDDDQRILDATKRGLGHAYHVVVAKNLEKALAQCEKHKPAAAIVDLHLGQKETGLDVIRAIKEGFPSIAIALLSGDLDHRATAEAARAGVAVIATKPIGPKHLVREVLAARPGITVLDGRKGTSPHPEGSRSLASQTRRWAQHVLDLNNGNRRKTAEE